MAITTIVDQVDANFKTHLQFCLRLALCASVQNWDSLKFFVQILKASTQGVWTAIKLFDTLFLDLYSNFLKFRQKKKKKNQKGDKIPQEQPIPPSQKRTMVIK
jgi:hypothetical protein